jgi:hypothetical protein
MMDSEKSKVSDTLLIIEGVHRLLSAMAADDVDNSQALYVLSLALGNSIEELREVVGEE